jgi:hypothetical protein
MLAGSNGEGGMGKGGEIKVNETMSHRHGMWIVCSLGATTEGSETKVK